jgi:uncharacterized membrane protein
VISLSSLAIILPKLELSHEAIGRWSQHMRWLVPSDPGMAQLMLGATAGSCITVVSVVYSVLLIALTFASMQFSPRILSSFIKDRISQTTLGLFIGTFGYSLILLPSVHSGTRDLVPTFSLSVSLVLSAICLFYLIYFIHHLAIAIQVNYIVDRIATEAEKTIEKSFGKSLKGFPAETPSPVEPTSGLRVVSRRSGYIQFLDERKLVDLADCENCTFFVHRVVGQYVPSGVALITIQGKAESSDKIKRKALSCFHIGALRSMEDDIEFGMLQLVDIALKAISPAVNDPSTAINCVDNLSRILVKAATLQPPSNQVLNEQGIMRLVRRQPNFPRLLAIAFDQIVPYAKNDMAVSLRIMRVLHDISGLTNYPPYLNAIRQMSKKIAKACGERFTEDDCSELNRRLTVIESRSRS